MVTPPTLTLTSRLLVRGMEATVGWSWPRRLFLSVGGFAAVALLEWRGGATVSVGFFYLLACAFAVWCLGEARGMGVAAAGAVASALIKHGQFRHLLLARPITPVEEWWNLAARLLSFALLAVLVSGLRGILALERWRGSHDALTGALNKGAFERAAPRTLERARAGGWQVLFAYLDLDGFKVVNDTHGHAAGDRVLCSFAAAAGGAVRASDLFARIGGDEFALVLLLAADMDGAGVATLLHRRLSAILRATGYDVTCSMGALVLRRDEVDPDDDVLGRADALMYEAKRGGKDAVRIGRGGAMATALRAAFPPVAQGDDDLDRLLARIDLAERRHRWAARHAA